MKINRNRRDGIPIATISYFINLLGEGGKGGAEGGELGKGI